MRSPEAEEVLRREDVRWRADGRCTQSNRQALRFARSRSSFRLFPARGIPNKCISLFFSSFFSSGWEPTRRECLETSGWDCASTLVIDDNDAFRGDCAFRHLERRRDRAIGKQSFSTVQRYRKYLHQNAST